MNAQILLAAFILSIFIRFMQITNSRVFLPPQIRVNVSDAEKQINFRNKIQ